ncbi:hypothetical protein [Nakamurella endophytica]|uniref:Uncharacterized protein n=1 Tax=Nakamurella endophytica TaxID=1748367 RepID=A0A917SLZ0_9ACTN|nr:hypothetical protein [Nakamurella endophytica]GGL85450.1 hypothetical protein GCM10011594_01380 [Nakamurella endophytica]
MPADKHPTQAVTPGAASEQLGPEPDAEMVDPGRAAEGQFPPLLDERTEVENQEDDPQGR